MTHTSTTFPNFSNSLNLTNDTIVFFGFPIDNRADKKADQFMTSCDEMGIKYREFSVAQSKHWHYEKCFEIIVCTDDDLNAIQPVISQFGELNALADADETVIVLRPRNEIQAMYTMITEAFISNESV